MSAFTRLVLALGTLSLFWFALFSSSAPDDPRTVAGGWGTATAPPPSDSTHASGGPELDGTSLDSLVASSRDALAQERWELALAPTRALAERFPTPHVYLARLAEIYNRLGRPAEEADAWEQYMERAPIPSEACPQIGQAYRALGQLDHAVAAFERCLASDPHNQELTFYVGLANEWSTLFTRAQEFYERANALAPPHNESLVGLARVDLHLTNFKIALDKAAEVLARAPNHVDALLVAGMAAQRAGQNRDARVHLERAVHLSGDYFDVQLALGQLEFSETRLAEARTRFEAAAQLDPERRNEVQLWLERTNEEARR